MATQKEIQTEINNLRAILDSGATSYAQDGESTTFDHASIRRRITELDNELARITGTRPKRPRIFGVNMTRI